MSRLPLDLFAEVTDATGTSYRWDANQDPGSRIQSFSFRTKIGEGFSDANGSLSRRIDQDYPDLRLVSDVRVVGADGSVAYEGRLSAQPRELGDSHSIGVTLTGWMAHAKDRKFTEIYVDRDLGSWGPPSLGKRATLLFDDLTPHDPAQTTDPTDSQAGIATGFEGAWVSPYRPRAQAWYDSGPGNTIGRVAYSWKRDAPVNPADGGWNYYVTVAPNDKSDGTEFTANLHATGPGGGVFAPTAPQRYAFLDFYYASTPGGSDGTRWGVNWYKLAVYGDHDLTLRTGQPSEPDGVLASDVLRNIVRRWCPQLNADGVQDTTYVVQHLAFKDRTYPYDAFLEVNKFHLWHLGVWDHKTLHFRPYDLTDYQWEIRTDDPGTTTNLQGPSIDDLFNGIVVSFTDLLSGTKNVLTPLTNPLELADPNPDNPWNQRAIEHWDELELSTPTTADQALQIGQAKLADGMRPKAPGTIVVRGYVRDRIGNQQPSWKIRAGDTIILSNFPNDAPRLIHETSYDDESKANTLSVEAPAASLDAILDRVAVAFTARGLG